MPDGKRLWRTEKGDLVREGDPSAAFLAYGIDDEVESHDRDAAKRLLDEKVSAAHTPKKAAAPTTKKKG